MISSQLLTERGRAQRLEVIFKNKSMERKEERKREEGREERRGKEWDGDDIGLNVGIS